MLEPGFSTQCDVNGGVDGTKNCEGTWRSTKYVLSFGVPGVIRIPLSEDDSLEDNLALEFRFVTYETLFAPLLNHKTK